MPDRPPRPGVDAGIRFRKVVRLPRAAYADSSRHFHITLTAHPEVTSFRIEVRDTVWAAVIEQAGASRVTLVAACLMPDHLHLVVRPANLDVLSFVQQWKRYTTRRAWAAGHRGGLW